MKSSFFPILSRVRCHENMEKLGLCAMVYVAIVFFVRVVSTGHNTSKNLPKPHFAGLVHCCVNWNRNFLGARMGCIDRFVSWTSAKFYWWWDARGVYDQSCGLWNVGWMVS